MFGPRLVTTLCPSFKCCNHLDGEDRTGCSNLQLIDAGMHTHHYESFFLTSCQTINLLSCSLKDYKVNWQAQKIV